LVCPPRRDRPGFPPHHVVVVQHADRLFAALYGVVSALSPALQIRRMRNAGSSESLSRGYILISAGGYLVWLVYGLALGNMPLIVCDAVGAAMQVTVLWWAFRLSSPPRTAQLG
jgi:uncharacterized protein with PQ loop repeat